MNIAVLGGAGQMGSVVANELAKYYKVTVLDSIIGTLGTTKNDTISYKITDAGNKDRLTKELKNYDLVICAVPSYLGNTVIESCIEAKVNCVDLSFADGDILKYNESAKQNGVIILRDCGVAPGLSSLLAGRAVAVGLKNIEIDVGGITTSPDKFDYKITWSLNDLYEEYTREAKFIKDGKVVSKPAMTFEKELVVNGKKFNAYVTDGLRTLLDKTDTVNYMVERTLRWPGHMDSIQDFIKAGKDGFVNKMKDKYKDVNDRDMLIMTVLAGKEGDVVLEACDNAVLEVYGDDSESAMAKTTAYSCVSFTKLLAEGIYTEKGVIPPEDIASNDDAYKFILDSMLEYSVEFSPRYPFLNSKE